MPRAERGTFTPNWAKGGGGGAPTVSAPDVTVNEDDTVRSITLLPQRIGQLAVVGRVGYIAVGTAAVSDWVRIT